MREEKFKSERVKEIINSAMNIIGEKGYEKTTINDIIKDVGIAKGTFYHYFKSKAELLEEVINSMWYESEALTQEFMPDKSIGALEKFNRLLEVNMEVKFRNIGFVLKLGSYLMQDENALIYQKMKDKSYEFILPYFKQIVSEGIEEGVLSTDDPELTAEHMFLVFSYPGNKTKVMSDPTYQLRLIKNKQATIEKVLGAPKGSLKFYEVWFEGIQKAKDFMRN